MERTSESFLGKCNFKIIGDGDMIADVRCWKGCGEKIVESTHLCYPPSWDNSAKPIAMELDIREMRDAQILLPHQSADFD